MPEDRASVDASANQTAGGCLARVLWMVAGNIALVLVLMSVARSPTWTLGPLDVFFWACLVGLVLVRYVDVTRLNGRTTEGEPATMAHFRRYAAGLTTLGGAAWSAAQSVQL
jgi:hypothetical protein